HHRLGGADLRVDAARAGAGTVGGLRVRPDCHQAAGAVGILGEDRRLHWPPLGQMEVSPWILRPRLPAVCWLRQWASLGFGKGAAWLRMSIRSVSQRFATAIRMA